MTFVVVGVVMAEILVPEKWWVSRMNFVSSTPAWGDFGMAVLESAILDFKLSVSFASLSVGSSETFQHVKRLKEGGKL